MRAHFKHQKFVHLICLLGLTGLAACGSRTLEKDGVIATVNKEPILASELQRSMALKARQDPMFKMTPQSESDQLEMIIDKKIIIQEALHKGLAREDSFTNTIKNFWEQTLIRNFLDYKRKEFADFISVTEDDILKYYTAMAKRVTFHILKSKDKRYLSDVLNRLIKGQVKADDPWEVVGPIGYEDINLDVLFDAFTMPVGTAKIIEDTPHSYLIQVVDSQAVELAPLATLRPEIEKRVVALKEKQMFDDWLNAKRKKARVDIIKNIP